MTNAKSRGAVWLEKLAPAGVPFLPFDRFRQGSRAGRCDICCRGP